MAAKTISKATTKTKATQKKKPVAKKARVEVDDDATEDSATSDDDAGSPGYDGAGDGSEEDDDEIEAVEVDSDDLDGSDEEEEEVQTKKKRKAPAKSSPKSGKKDSGGKNTREVEVGVKTAAPKEKGARAELGRCETVLTRFLVAAATSLILPTTMEFLKQLHANNDRDWLAVNGE